MKTGLPLFTVIIKYSELRIIQFTSWKPNCPLSTAFSYQANFISPKTVTCMLTT